METDRIMNSGSSTWIHIFLQALSHAWFKSTWQLACRPYLLVHACMLYFTGDDHLIWSWWGPFRDNNTCHLHDVDAWIYLARVANMKHVVQKCSSRASTSAHVVVITTYTVCMDVACTLLEGTSWQRKKKNLKPWIVTKKKNKKNKHSSIITVPTAVDIFLYAQDQAFN